MRGAATKRDNGKRETRNEKRDPIERGEIAQAWQYAFPRIREHLARGCEGRRRQNSARATRSRVQASGRKENFRGNVVAFDFIFARSSASRNSAAAAAARPLG